MVPGFGSCLETHHISISYLERQGNGVRVIREGEEFLLYKEKLLVGRCGCTRQGEGWQLGPLWVDPDWRRRGYGSFLLRQVLKNTGGYTGESLHFLELGEDAAEKALAEKFGFSRAGNLWRRHRVPDPTAVGLTHDFLGQNLLPGGFFVDATCGNGGDTEFLCRLAGPQGKVLALDLQQQAVDNTNARLAAEGLSDIGRAVQADHANLAQLVEKGSADCVVFNFGYLPGADHSLFTTPKSSLPAVKAALAALRPGGILAACLYSGGPNGDGEKNALLEFFRALPIREYTVLVCEFANWAPTAPLPCFVRKKGW